MIPIISKARVRNYQSIESLDIEFGRITVIQGPSCSGKSAFCRALLSVLNDGIGKSKVRRGSEESGISIIYKGKNVAMLRSSEGLIWGLDGEKYTKTGGIPSKIVKALDLLYVGEDVVNFHSQLDSPFSLLTKGETSKLLLSILGFDFIDGAISACKRDITVLNTEESLLEKQVEPTKKALEAISTVQNLDEIFNSLQKRYRIVRASIDLMVVSFKKKIVLEVENSLELLKIRLRDLEEKYKKLEVFQNLVEKKDQLKLKEEELSLMDKNIIEAREEISKFKQCPVCGANL